MYTSIHVLGERNCGTNYLLQLLKGNVSIPAPKRDKISSKASQSNPEGNPILAFGTQSHRGTSVLYK